MHQSKTKAQILRAGFVLAGFFAFVITSTFMPGTTLVGTQLGHLVATQDVLSSARMSLAEQRTLSDDTIRCILTLLSFLGAFVATATSRRFPFDKKTALTNPAEQPLFIWQVSAFPAIRGPSFA